MQSSQTAQPPMQVVLIKITNYIDPFGNRLVESYSATPNNQRFIKQYYLNETQLRKMVDDAQRQHIKIEMSSSLGDDSFLPHAQFKASSISPAPTNAMMLSNPSESYRLTCNAKNANTIRTMEQQSQLEPMPINGSLENFANYTVAPSTAQQQSPSPQFPTCGGGYMMGKNKFISK